MKDYKKFWDKQAENFNSNSNNESIELVNKSKKYLTSNDVVLDFACGTGGSTLEIAQYAKEIQGVDYSKEMIKFAKAKVEFSQNITFVATTIEDHRFEEESYDVIVAYNILHLLDNFDHDMTRLHKLLKPGGFLISNTACMGEKKNLFSILTILGKNSPSSKPSLLTS